MAVGPILRLLAFYEIGGKVSYRAGIEHPATVINPRERLGG
jgi:hypothetical protein